ncbi:FAD-dependent oxidoreductase [Rhodococcus ruber BKS 20-38]|uniref:FAD-dependent oxidoreductase n=2 Tax=Rhodococcus ruber TaxID=1830 RepID=M2ZPZ6_9NOCA|nr:FAD-dependent oxidoreductase [Rhodococcus ruber BKS 20-38]
MEELRRLGFDGDIVMIGDERHLPYDRPPLSKDVVRGENPDTTLRPLSFFSEQRIDLRLGRAAVNLDVDARTLSLVDGEVISFDELVVATGLRPRRLPGSENLAGVHVLRSLDDSRALGESVGSKNRALVIGAGFIGCEVAANLRTLGMEVALVEPQASPLAAVLGREVGERIGHLHSSRGVDVRAGVGVRELTQRRGRVTGAVLDDDSRLEVDLVVVGIGSVPATDWLEGSGVEIDNGVVCDAVGRTSAPHVWAVGDVAAWGGADERRRLEHWTSAGEQARVVAGALLGSHEAPVKQIPYFWSDQYELKIQALGEVGPMDAVHMIHTEGDKFLAYYERNGRICGVVGAGLPAQVMRMRSPIAAQAAIAEVLASAR